MNLRSLRHLFAGVGKLGLLAFLAPLQTTSAQEEARAWQYVDFDGALEGLVFGVGYVL